MKNSDMLRCALGAHKCALKAATVNYIGVHNLCIVCGMYVHPLTGRCFESLDGLREHNCSRTLMAEYIKNHG